MTIENSTTKPKFIILEGVDRSGKNSMQDAINAATKYKHFVMDRGPIGFKAYCEIFGKDQSLLEYYDKMEKELEKLEDVLVLYIDCDTDVLIDRCIQTDHEIIDYKLHKHFYEQFFNISNLNKIKVDSTNLHVSEIAEMLVKEGIL